MEESIEAQVQKELDAISLSSSDFADDNYDRNAQDESKPWEIPDDESTLLFLEKSSARNKHSREVLDEAEDLLSKCVVTSISLNGKENSTNNYQDDDTDFYDIPFMHDRWEVITAKTIEEIEDDNRAKEEELELHLKSDHEKVCLEIQKGKIIEEQELRNWESKEEKTNKSMKIMLDKANYWERTYEEEAQDQFAKKQKELEEEFLHSQKKIAAMENEERKFLESLLKEQEMLVTQKREQSALKIQTHYRGYAVRKVYGATLRKRMKIARDNVTAQKIAAIKKKRREKEDREMSEVKQRNAESTQVSKDEKRIDQKQKNSKANEKKAENDKDPKNMEAGNDDTQKQLSEAKETNIKDKHSPTEEIPEETESKVVTKQEKTRPDFIPNDSERKTDLDAAEVTDQNEPLQSTTCSSETNRDMRTFPKSDDTSQLPDERTELGNDTSHTSHHIMKEKHQITNYGSEESVSTSTNSVITVESAPHAKPRDYDDTIVSDVKSSTANGSGKHDKMSDAMQDGDGTCIDVATEKAQKAPKTVAGDAEGTTCTIVSSVNLSKICTTDDGALQNSVGVLSDRVHEISDTIHNGADVSKETASEEPRNMSDVTKSDTENIIDDKFENAANAETENSMNTVSDNPDKMKRNSEYITGVSSENPGKISNEVKHETETSVDVVSDQLHDISDYYEVPQSTEYSKVVSNSNGIELISSSNSNPMERTSVEEFTETDNVGSVRHGSPCMVSEYHKLDIGKSYETVPTDSKLQNSKAQIVGDKNSVSSANSDNTNTVLCENVTHVETGNEPPLNGNEPPPFKLAVEVLGTSTKDVTTENMIPKGSTGNITVAEKSLLQTDTVCETKNMNSQDFMQNMNQSDDSISRKMEETKSATRENRTIEHSHTEHFEKEKSTKINADIMDQRDVPKMDKVETSKEQKEISSKFLSRNEESDRNENNSGVSTSFGDNNLSVDLENSNHYDFDESYRLRLHEQQCAWSLRMREYSKHIDEFKPSSIQRKRRKIIRSSSAAKRLPPFSNAEILEGAFTSSVCDISSKTSCDDEVRCIVLSNVHGGRNFHSFSKLKSLTHLTVQNCGLLSLESLQNCHNLKYVSAFSNAINLISCSGMKQLEYLDLSHNHLTSIHGLDECENLLFLDLSHNNITKITGLNDVRNLAHFRISENQLLSVSGLNECGKLLYLDISDNHLTHLDDLADNKLLVSVNAAGNYIEYLGEKFLDNAILLIQLDVSRNSLPSFGLSEKTWLPSLIEIHAQTNRIGYESSRPLPNFALSCPFLSHLDLKKNFIADLDCLKSMKHCRCLNHVNVNDNPMTTSTDDQYFLKSMPEIVSVEHEQDRSSLQGRVEKPGCTKFCVLSLFANNFANLIHGGLTYDIQNIIDVSSMYLHKVQIEGKRHLHEVQKAFLKSSSNREVFGSSDSVPPNIFTIHTTHLKNMQQISSNARDCHEAFGQTENPQNSQMDENFHKDILRPSGCSFESQPKYNRGIGSILQHPQTPDKRPVSSSISHSEAHFSPSPSSLELSNQTSRNFAVYEKLRRLEFGALENVAAKKLQALWRGYRVRKRHKLIKNARLSAAVVIQALWRGYRTRKKIKHALNLLKENEKIEAIDDDDLEDVDLDGLHFDEQSFEEQWAYRVTNQESKYPQPSEDVQQRSSYREFHEGFQRAENPETMSFSSSKPPLPPITPKKNSRADARTVLTPTISETDGSYCTDTNRSRNSSKQDILSNEWGIKSSSTADLMMKRARRMKGARKKTRTADEKLQKFQEKISTFQAADFPLTNRQQPNRIEYFKAREQEFHRKDKIPGTEDEQNMNYTYEWVHKQVGGYYNRDRKSTDFKKPRSSDTDHTRSVILPTIPRSPSLVGTQDLEVISLNSGSSYMERSKDRLRDIARRHNPHSSHTMN